MRTTSNARQDAVRASTRSAKNVFKGFMVAAGLMILASCSQMTPAPQTPSDPPAEPPKEASWEWSPVGYDANTLAPSATSADFQVRGSGTDIWDERDEFFFVYTRLEGDGFISVRVKDFRAVDPWAKAGVMLRESLDPSAPNVLLHISNQNGSVLQARMTRGASTVNSAGHDTTMTPGGWVRLTRAGDTVIGELSRDGVTWSELGRYELPFGDDVLIGVAVTAHARGEIATATFGDLEHGVGRPTDGPGDDPGAPEPVPTPDPSPTPTPTPPTPTPSRPAPGGGYDLPPATLYVAPNGNDANSGRSSSAPLRTITQAAALVRPGDVVYMRGGTYPINVHFKTSGTAAQPIVWASYPGETAVLDGSDRARGSSQDRVWVDAVSFNHFVNFEVRNSPQQGIFVRDSNDNLFHGIVTHGNNGSGIQNYSGNRNRYEYIVTYDNFDTVNGNGKVGEDADGLGISAGDSNVISHVISYFNSDDGIDAWRSTNTLIEHSISFDNGRGANGNGNGFKLGGNGEANYTVARFNIAFANKATGFSQNSGRFITLYNNTAFGNSGSSFDVGSTVTLRNNLSINGRVNLVSGADSRSNSWELGIGDARFKSTDRASPDFLALSAGSPAIEAGVDVGLPYAGGAPDLGALQYGATIADLLDSTNPLAELVRAALGGPVLAAAR